MHTLKNSDNSASDALLQAANGPRYVAKRMNALGFKNISINRSIMEMFIDTNHVDRSFLKNANRCIPGRKYLIVFPLKKNSKLGSALKKTYATQLHRMIWQNCS